ncbi:hypothetical protein DTW90_30505 [Neorhizobium sp. P12A]|jgi:hypothetical protein|nr:hypothetical protein DTW90_30505 [Neorhizobium sp. P12A]
MKAYAEPPAGSRKNDCDGQKRGTEILGDSVDDEYHEGRNWAVLLILTAIIVSWAIGLVFLIWSVFG